MPQELDRPIRYLTGVGEKRAALYSKLSIETVGDLLHHYPRDYIDFSAPAPIDAAPFDRPCAIRARVAHKSGEQRIRRGLSLFKVLATDGAHDLTITFFNARYAVAALKEEEEYLFYGRVGGSFSRREMRAPLVFPAAESGGLYPVYPLTEGLSSKMIAANVRQALQLVCADVEDILPDALRQQYALCHAGFALAQIHFPDSPENLDTARRRLQFEELFLLNLALAQLKKANAGARVPPLPAVGMAGFTALLPFTLTGAQRRAIDDCLDDFAGTAPMRRLLQGDVGSGKTMVAAACAYFMRQNGCQTAIMAPTEILAGQHFETFSRLFGPACIPVGLLTGSMKAAEKNAVKAALADGSLPVVVGTHALLQGDVAFQNLRLVVTDEQHRFGVGQRMALTGKGADPHMLVMSATPIPRTLAFIIYGDLDLSLLDELPAGRQPVKTYLMPPAKRKAAYGFIRQHLDAGEQAYLVYPLVEQSDAIDGLADATEAAARLAVEEFAGYRVGLIHGRMKGDEKDRVMADFKAGRIQLLAATTVIEVGMDVPAATIMLIENAERFGLSQLHQLRGRVGRGRAESFCFLVSAELTSPRLQAICRTNDGFAVAEEDLRLRGPGDFFGARQHGLPALSTPELLSDLGLVNNTRQAADLLLRSDPGLAAHDALRARTARMLAHVVGAG